MLTTVLPALLALSAPQQPSSTAEMLPLQHICSEDQEQRSLPWGSLLRYAPDDLNANFVFGSEGGGAVSPDAIVDTLYGFMSTAIDEQRLFLQTIDRNLLAVGETKLVERVRDLIHEASGILARPVQVELAVWDAASDDAPATTLDAKGYAEFAANRSPLWRAVSTANAGQAVTIEHMTWSRYVRSIEIEVAQKKTMSRPATDRYGEGGCATVRAFSLVGSDDFAVHMQFAIAARRGVIGTLQTGLPGASDIELPQLDSYFGTCSGRIPNGGALAATMRGNSIGGGQVTVTLRVSSSGQSQQLSDKNAVLWPIGALVSDGLAYSADLPDVHSESNKRDFDKASVYGRIPSDNLKDLIGNTLSAIEEDSEHDLRIGGGYLFVRCSPSGIARVKQLMLSIQQRMLQNVAVQHRAYLQPVTAGQSQPAGSMLHELSIPTLLGREASVYRLRESNIVANVFIEVASEAGSLSPGMQLLQSGTWLRTRAIPVGKSLHVNLDLLSAMAPVPPMRSVMPGGGVLMQAEVASARNDHDGIITPGRVIQHGDGPRVTIDGREFKSTMSTTFVR
jgi:hypothetical protein